MIVFGYRPAPIGGEVADLAKAVHELGEQHGRTTRSPQVQRHRPVGRRSRSSWSTTVRPRRSSESADEHDALAIVVGAAGRGPIAGSLLGSVTYQVVHRSTRPVVVVPAPDA